LEPWRERVDSRQAEKPLSLPDVALHPDIREFVLPNGLRILMAPSLAHPVIDIRLVTSGDYLFEPQQQIGVGYLAAALRRHSFLHQPTYDDRDDLNKLSQMGGKTHVSQSATSTIFGINGLASFADGFLWQLHVAMTPFRYDASALKELIKQERKGQTRRDELRRRRSQVLSEILFGRDHPYATRLRQADSLERLSIGNIDHFRDLHHRIGSTTLIATGRFDAAAFEAHVRRLFGKMPARVAPPLPAIPPVARRDAPTYLAITSEEQAQIGITIAFATEPGFREQHAARLVLAEMLRGCLTLTLRHEKALSYSVDVGHIQDGVGPGHLLIEAAVDPERAGEAFLLMQEAIRHLLENDFAADFVRARRQVVEALLGDALSSRRVADALELIAANQLPLDYFDRLPERVAALRMDDIRALMATELPAASEVVIASGQRASLSAMYQAAGIHDYRVLNGDW
jgi:zinc protease